MASLNPVTGTLGTRRSAHILKRATFGPNKSDISFNAGRTANQALTELFQTNTIPVAPADYDNFKSWWVERMFTSGRSIVEKMVFFYHTHFTTKEEVVQSNQALYHQNQLFRYYALGNFKELTKKICLDNAMMIFLDGRDNDRNNVNENFGRELLELYSIGKGPQIGPGDYTNYTEQDVKEAARVLSGYGNDEDFLNVDPATGIPTSFVKNDGGTVATAHDAGVKIFSDKFQNTTIQPNALVGEDATVAATLDELDQLIDMIFNQPETAGHICRKLYRFFMYYEITSEIKQDIIEPLANTFRTNNYEIQPVLQQLFNSEHFYDADNAIAEDNNHAALIKSPLELVVGTLRYFRVALPASGTQEFYDAVDNGIIGPMRFQGMDLLEPYEVAGYPAYHQNPDFNRNWISHNHLARRYEYIGQLMNGMDNFGFQLDAVAFVENNISDPSGAQVVVQELVDDLLPEIITTARFDYFLNDVLLDGLSMGNWTTEWFAYQGSGDDSAVRTQLEALFNALMQSPEYQLH
jgi:uncharacterized protein (DUF1800 family)